MCERLALTTRDLLLTHSRLYDSQYRQDYFTKSSTTINTTVNMTPSPSSHTSPQAPSPASTAGEISEKTTIDNNVSAGKKQAQKQKQKGPEQQRQRRQRQKQQNPSSQLQPPMNQLQGGENDIQPIPLSHTLQAEPSTGIASQTTLEDGRNSFAQQQSALPLLAGSFPFTTSDGEIDFNSSEFLYDSALFGQIMLDTTTKSGSSTQTGSSSGQGESSSLPMSGYPSVYMCEQSIFPTGILHNNTNPINMTSPNGGSSSASSVDRLDISENNKSMWSESST